MDLDFMKSFNIMLYEEEEQEEDIAPPETIKHDQIRDAEDLHNRQEPSYKDKPKLKQIFYLPKSIKSIKSTNKENKYKKKVKVNRT